MAGVENPIQLVKGAPIQGPTIDELDQDLIGLRHRSWDFILHARGERAIGIPQYDSPIGKISDLLPNGGVIHVDFGTTHDFMQESLSSLIFSVVPNQTDRRTNPASAMPLEDDLQEVKPTSQVNGIEFIYHPSRFEEIHDVHATGRGRKSTESMEIRIGEKFLKLTQVPGKQKQIKDFTGISTMDEAQEMVKAVNAIVGELVKLPDFA